jgi:hypothetical protein
MLRRGLVCTAGGAFAAGCNALLLAESAVRYHVLHCYSIVHQLAASSATSHLWPTSLLAAARQLQKQQLHGM